MQKSPDEIKAMADAFMEKHSRFILGLIAFEIDQKHSGSTSKPEVVDNLGQMAQVIDFLSHHGQAGNAQALELGKRTIGALFSEQQTTITDTEVKGASARENKDAKTHLLQIQSELIDIMDALGIQRGKPRN